MAGRSSLAVARAARSLTYSVVVVMGAACGPSESNHERGSETPSVTDSSTMMVRREPGLLGRGDSVAFVDLRLRMVARQLLRYDSAMGHAPATIETVMQSAFAPNPSDLVDVWGTPIRVQLSGDSAVLASAGPTQRWGDSMGVIVTAFYQRTDSGNLRTRAASLRGGQVKWDEWWWP